MYTLEIKSEFGDFGYVIKNGGYIDGVYWYPGETGLPIVLPWSDAPVFTEEARDAFGIKMVEIEGVEFTWPFPHAEWNQIYKVALECNATGPDSFLKLAKTSVTQNKIRLYKVDYQMDPKNEYFLMRNKFSYQITEECFSKLSMLGWDKSYNINKCVSGK